MHLEPLLPPDFNRYFEPMVGGGALFLRLQPEQAIIGDSNAELINFYSILRDNTEELIAELAQLEPSAGAYYEARDLQPTTTMDSASQFAFLNRLAWNGVYRVNRQGKFNVPFGKRVPEQMWDFDNMRAIAEVLKSARLFAGDFEQCIASARPGDFVFLDPPYPRGANNGMGFNRYTARFFSFEDHKRLAGYAMRLAECGILVLVAESSHPKIAGLYPDEFNRVEIVGRSLIAGKASARKPVRELLLHSYDVRW